ncbi:MAG TPA: aminotransferase class V-fold PLP-dependent enzyme [Candidatus Polarisedimenticolia bacterium]|nr:aminotransferase class V-fold PLP-dependent enzyme [Candidatus Polarisedimenticolia bacterium]
MFRMMKRNRDYTSPDAGDDAPFATVSDRPIDPPWRPEMEALEAAFEALEGARPPLPPFAATLEWERLRSVLVEAAGRLADNFPYGHPLYVGQMLKPPHPAARLAYALAMTINPNNHALDGGRASSAMEREAVAALAALFGWSTHLGHLCGGGTMANFEALWVGRQERPGKGVAASTQAHYTHARLSEVLGVPFQGIATDPHGRIDPGALAAALQSGTVGTVVATLGTTAAGAVDPLPEILDLCRARDVRVHADAAYGGYFTLAGNLDPPARAAFDRIAECDSIVIDPHKHGLQPYGCGAVLFRDPAVGRHYRHDSPYTYFTGKDLHLGEISLECSRPGAAAVALWTTLRLLPLVKGGEFARGLEAGREAALQLHQAVAEDPRFAAFGPPELDIVVFSRRAASASAASEANRRLFETAAAQDLHLALAAFPRHMLEGSGAVTDWDVGTLTCLRACVMKPEHRAWMPEILARLRRAADAAGEP